MQKTTSMLEQLRSKPDHVKSMIALVATVVIFIIIASVWFTAGRARLQAEEAQAEAVSPLAGLATMFSGLVADVKSIYSKTPSSDAEQSTTTASSTQGASVFDVFGVVVIDTPTE